MNRSVRSGWRAESWRCGSSKRATGMATGVRWPSLRVVACAVGVATSVPVTGPPHVLIAPVPDPEADQHEPADPEEQGHEALGHRADAAQTDAPGVVGCWMFSVT